MPSYALNLANVALTASPNSNATVTYFTGNLQAQSLDVQGAFAPANGLFEPSNNVLGFTTNSIERLRITGGGNLLVGSTTAPTGGNVMLLINSAGTNGAGTQLVGGTAGGGTVYGINGGGLAINTYTGAIGSETYLERLRINSVGNVGINTSNPTTALNVWGRISVPVTSSNGDIKIGNNGQLYDDGNFHVEGGLTSGALWINAQNGNDLNLNQQQTGNAYLVAGGGSVGIGTTSVGGRLTVRGNTSDNATIDIKNNATNIWKLWNDNGSSGLNFQYNGTTRWTISSAGTLSQTATAGTYTIDVTNGATSVANAGTVNFSNASGMLVVNNYSTGGVTIYLCGGGVTPVAVGSVVGQVGTLAYNAGIAGYTWTNNSGVTATFGFFFLRTRPTA